MRHDRLFSTKTGRAWSGGLCVGLFLCFAVGATLFACSFFTQKTRARATPHDWALTATAALALAYDCQRIDLLGWDEKTEENIARWKIFLRDYWGIQSRDDLLRNVNWLEEGGGHRILFKNEGERLAAMTTEQLRDMINNSGEDERFRILVVLRNYEAQGTRGILAWDWNRVIHIAGWSWFVGYISEDEAWRIIMPIARDLQKNYKSWDDVVKGYMIGREYWSLQQTKLKGQKLFDAHQQLLKDPRSPYHTIPWDLNLGKE